MDSTATTAKLEAGIGAGLMTTPLWINWLQEVSVVAAAVTSICGAILGVHAVWRLHKRGWK